jgi:hypothetical protein
MECTQNPVILLLLLLLWSRHNVKLGGMLYNIFAYSLGTGDKQQFYTLGKRDNYTMKYTDNKIKLLKVSL